MQLQLDDLGIDYITRRTKKIAAVTLDDAKRVAKRLFDGGILVPSSAGRRGRFGQRRARTGKMEPAVRTASQVARDDEFEITA